MSGVEVRLNGSELPYLRSRDSAGSKVGEEWNEDSFVEDYGTVISGGDELTLDDLTGGVVGKWDPQAEDLDASEAEDGDGNATDGSESSLDLHTPLPCVFSVLSYSFALHVCFETLTTPMNRNLMLRDGLLSPHSKILPENLRMPSPLLPSSPFDSLSPGGRPGSTLSLASNAGSIMTKSGIYKDERDTVRRRVRHRDGKLLKGGIGLTTGLGWSDRYVITTGTSYTAKYYLVASTV